jgi:diamine N-acetyltransferase
VSEIQSPTINIQGERIGLGPLARGLVPLYFEWSNEVSTSQTIGLTWPATLDSETSLFEARIRDSSAVWFTIFKLQENRPIGLAWLYDIDHRHARASFGISIGAPEHRGHGFGTETTALTLDYAFNALGLENVMLTVVAFNESGIGAYEKAGFRTFGRRRRCTRFGGVLHDLIYMECTATDFSSPVLARFLYDGERITRD